MPLSHAPFRTTHWSAILGAQCAPAPEAATALARLCEAYWYPVYAFLRRKGHPPHAAEDLTQGFFAHILQRDWLRNVGPEKGRFRTFVLRCLTNFVANQPRLPATVPIVFGDAEERFAFEPSHHITPDRLFELRWAAALLDQAAARLRREAESDGRPERFAALFPYLTKETSPGSFADVAACLGLSEAAARQEVSRLRKCFREAIRDEIAEVVSGPEEIEDELRHLLNVFSA
jgi:DNA-directed RNA polymerase specialized sigma24 family protein